MLRQNKDYENRNVETNTIYLEYFVYIESFSEIGLDVVKSSAGADTVRYPFLVC